MKIEIDLADLEEIALCITDCELDEAAALIYVRGFFNDIVSDGLSEVIE